MSDSKPATELLKEWVRKELSKHKVPTHFWWIGEEGMADQFPKTGSGKIIKTELKKIGEEIVKKS